MTTTSTLDTLGLAKYISLTTFRKDGTPVATPVWLVRDGGQILAITDPSSGKAKRLRNNPAAQVTVCDMRGRVKPGAVSAAAHVEFQDDASTANTMRLISQRYGFMGRILTKINERKARRSGATNTQHVGLSITLDPPAEASAPN